MANLEKPVKFEAEVQWAFFTKDREEYSYRTVVFNIADQESGYHAVPGNYIAANDWEARDPRGNLRAIVTWDSQFSLYYVSAGEMEWEAFCSFRE